MTAEERLASSSERHSCGFCGSAAVQWVHPLNARHIAYSVYGKGCTLPGFWTTCADCESLLAAGDDDALLERMKWDEPDHSEWSRADVVEILAPALTAFRLADQGPLPLQ